LDSLDIVSVDNYTFVPKHRKQKTLRKSGGIGTFVRQDIMKYVTFLESESEFVQWLKISQILVGTDEDVYFGIVYIPPENSKYCNNNDLNMFYAELELYNNNNKYVAMMGDFNARTSNKLDVAISDERIFEALDLDFNFVNDGDA